VILRGSRQKQKGPTPLGSQALLVSSCLKK
jgi:hypothetical protein